MRVYLNGVFLEEVNAHISPFDRGFLYGDGIFETIKCIEGKPMLLREHVKRLKSGLKELNISIKEEYRDFKLIIESLLDYNSLRDCSAYVRISISRGVTKALRDFDAKNPTVFIFTRKIDEDSLSNMRKKGVILKTVTYYRSFLPHLKHLNYLASIYSLMNNRDCDEVLFLDERKKILEGATSNIFFVNEKAIYTPKNKILKGLYRDFIIKKMRALNFKVLEQEIPLGEIGSFYSAFITNSIIQIIPVRKIDQVEFDIQNRLFQKLCSF